jgi:hypothetical protein
MPEVAEGRSVLPGHADGLGFGVDLLMILDVMVIQLGGLREMLGTIAMCGLAIRSDHHQIDPFVLQWTINHFTAT